ncbi:hypothetical protein GQ55_7G187100 [Panicum hallii var. hallii]|uniref:Uncharacterized protein n=1 Tax=Panicum hallii var. hallii TaxID=1504633 RepID=A0A2T7CWH7_9POAL|nr:hypothetical protein GQ55_7G187100 [Panicum hallii var. hallii]
MPAAAPNQRVLSCTIISFGRTRPAADRTRITWRNSLSTPCARHELAARPDARSADQQPSKIVVATRGGRGIPIRRRPHVRREPACRRRARAAHREREREIEML